MKINVSFNPTELKGYTNHCIVKTGTYNIEPVDVGEATEIIADAIIEYIPRTLVEPVMKDWISKLGHGGKITFTFDDLNSICRLFFLQRITFAECNFLLQGPMMEPWQDKKVNYTIPEISKVLESAGLKVVVKEVSGTKAIVTGVRE